MSAHRFVLTTGLTQRLIEAHDEESAVASFVSLLKGDGMHKRDFTPMPGEILVRPASDEDVEAFKRKRPQKTFADLPMPGVQWPRHGNG